MDVVFSAMTGRIGDGRATAGETTRSCRWTRQGMCMDEPGQAAHLSVVGGGGTNGDSSIRGLITDGTAVIAVGAAAASGFGVETVKSIATGEANGLWWFVVLTVSSLVVVVLELWLRMRARRKVRVGVVITALDPRRGLARARQLDQQAQSFSQATCSATLRAAVQLGAGERWGTVDVDALADEVITATTLAARLTPDAAQINLVPTMPLHIGFRVGARLGYTHSRKTLLFAIRQGAGSPAYFAAVSLRTSQGGLAPLVVKPVQALGHGSAVALALDLQGRGDEFTEPVLAACRQQGVGHLLVIGTESSRLVEETSVFTAAVEQGRLRRS
ncbi:hypothetical protein [Umezawaea sp. Da 62-37]|uniref:hypothetical protein n=1 Tax=Umezawaea sp. Da 62-37 TaxID=3075927 RepID=UPI0028F6CFC5|nr:hypothetical protein [Umezawaea sp. Da 62-37]WNV83908.1 hypothetical protein RM788_37945 [Umezawaea sp. Da 62-37]